MGVQNLIEQKVTCGSTSLPAHALNLGQFLNQPFPLGHNLGSICPHDGQAPVPQRRLRKRARGASDVVRGLHAVQHAGNGRGGEGGAEADAGHAKGLGQGLHDDKIGVLGDELGEGRVPGRKVNVCLVEDHDAGPRRVVEDLDYMFLGEEGAGRVAGGAKVGQLDVGLAGQGGGHGGDVEGELGGGREGHLDDVDVVDLGGHGVHAVRRGARQDAVLAGDAEAAQQGVDGLVAADADEQVLGADGLGGVGVRVAQPAEQLLQLGLVRVGVSVQTERIEAAEGRAGVLNGGWVEGRSVGVLVGVEEHVGAVVLVVTACVRASRFVRRGGSFFCLLSCTAVRLQRQDVGSRAGF